MSLPEDRRLLTDCKSSQKFAIFEIFLEEKFEGRKKAILWIVDYTENLFVSFDKSCPEFWEVFFHSYLLLEFLRFMNDINIDEYEVIQVWSSIIFK